MQSKSLTNLLEELEQKLMRLGYTEGSLKFYRRRWKMLLDFAKSRGENYFSEQLGIDFVEKHFNILEKDFEKTLCQKDTQELRVIRMVGEAIFSSTTLCFGAITNTRKSCQISTTSKLAMISSSIVKTRITQKPRLTIM